MNVAISISPSTLYILCSSSGLLLRHIRVDRVSMPSPKCSAMVGVVSVNPQIRKII